MMCLFCRRSVKGNQTNKELCYDHYVEFKESAMSYKDYREQKITGKTIPSLEEKEIHKYFRKDDWMFICPQCQKHWRIMGQCTVFVLSKYYNMEGAHKGKEFEVLCDFCEKKLHAQL